MIGAENISFSLTEIVIIVTVAGAFAEVRFRARQNTKELERQAANHEALYDRVLAFLMQHGERNAASDLENRTQFRPKSWAGKY